MSTRIVNHFFLDGNACSREYKKEIKDISMHWHDCYEIDIVLAGSGETICNGKTFPIKKGLVSLLAPTDFHEYKTEEALELINIKFDEAEIDYELLSTFLSRKASIIYADDKRLKMIEAMSSLIGGVNSRRYAQKYNGKMIESMILMFLDCGSQENKLELESEVIQKAVMYISAHFGENPKMTTIAELCHLNPNYFCRLFKKCVGMSYKEYLKKVKLDYARKLIKTTSLSFMEITEKCGYETQSHFNREFKAYFEKTPSDMRK